MGATSRPRPRYQCITIRPERFQSLSSSHAIQRRARTRQIWKESEANSLIPADRVQTSADSSKQKVSALRARMCVKEKGDRMNRTTCKEGVSKCQQQCQQAQSVILTHTYEEAADTGQVMRTRLARFKRQLKRGPRMGRKALARFVVQEGRRQGLCSG